MHGKATILQPKHKSGKKLNTLTIPYYHDARCRTNIDLVSNFSIITNHIVCETYLLIK